MVTQFNFMFRRVFLGLILLLIVMIGVKFWYFYDRETRKFEGSIAREVRISNKINPAQGISIDSEPEPRLVFEYEFLNVTFSQFPKSLVLLNLTVVLL